MKTYMKFAALAVVAGAGLLASTVQASEEPYCREFTQNIVVGGKTRQGYGTACLQPNGAWQVVSQQDETMAPQAAVLPTVNYVVQEPVYVQQPVYVQRPEPFPVYLSFGYSNSWGNRGWGGHGGGWGHGGGHGGWRH